MKSLFIDTSALIAIGNKRDSFHEKSLLMMTDAVQNKRHFLTTDAVLLEFGNAFSSINFKPTAIKMIDAAKKSKYWKCINVDPLLMKLGFEKYCQFIDKSWGFIDCISMIVAEKNDIDEIFTTDHHFEQAGFSILLK